MAITQTITAIPKAGKRGIDTRDAFVIKQESFQDALTDTFVTEINAFREQANTLETNVNNKEASAIQSATTATTKATEASSSATSALASMNAAKTSETNASASEVLAGKWANENANVIVQSGKYSAKHYALKAEEFMNMSDAVKLTGNQEIAGVKTFSASPIVPVPTTDFQVATKQYVDSTITDRIGIIDYGYVAKSYHIVAFGGEFNRANYPKLWEYLQANQSLLKTQAQWQVEATANDGICGFFSDGNGTTTFRVPSLDKAFLRPDSRGIGSYQSDAIRNITGSAKSILHRSESTGTGALKTTLEILAFTTDGAGRDAATLSFDASLVVPTANENRPKNIAVLPLIVAK